MGIFQQFPYSNFHEMNLDQIIKIMRQMQDEWEATKTEWASYKEFIDNYFENLDVSQEVLDAMRVLAADGTLATVVDPTIAAETSAWLAEHITQPTTPAIDTSLSVAGAAADAKAVGDAIAYDMKPFPDAITSTYVSSHPAMADIRSWQSNYAYTLGGDAYSAISPLPAGFNTLGTLVKFNGTRRTAGGYSSYILFNTASTWVGFDNGSNIFWKKIPTITDSSTVLAFEQTVTAAYASANNMTDLRTWQSNYIYNLGSDVAGAVAHFPQGFRGLGTVAKLSGNANRNLSGYCIYVLNASVGSWLGFDGGSQIYWQKVITKKNIVVIGDSYAEGYSHDGTNDGWAALFQNYYADSEAQFTLSYLGGASFAGSNSFENLIIPSAFVTDIVVCGGFNDNGKSQAQIESAISAFMTSAKAQCPNAKVHIGFVGWIKEGSGTGALSNWQTIKNNLITAVMPAYKNCVKYGAEYLNNVELWINDAGLTPSDGYHPSQAGNENLAAAIVNAVKTGSAPMPYHDNLRL